MADVRRLLLELVAFATPRAITINTALIVALLAAWPTQRLSLMPVRSVWENVFGFRPYSAGMMRSLSRILHGDFEGAWQMNPLGYPTLAILLALGTVNAARWYRTARRAAPMP